MAKTGRPPTPDDDQTVVVRLKKRHVEILDAAIRALRVSNRDLKGAWLRRGESRVFIVDPETPTQVERRRLLGDLIEERLSFEELFPTIVQVRVSHMEDVDEQRLTQLWIEDKQQELTRDAPECVRRTIAWNKLRHLDRDSPEAFLALIERIFRRLESADGDKKRETTGQPSGS